MDLREMLLRLLRDQGYEAAELEMGVTDTIGTQVPGSDDWLEARREVFALQRLLYEAGFDPGALDGYVGPSTRHAMEEQAATWGEQVQWVRPEPLPLPPTQAKPAPSPVLVVAAPPKVVDVERARTKWPRQNEAEMNAFFGPRGQNMVSLELPYPMRIAWDMGKTVRRFDCNSKCAVAFGRVFGEALAHYGLPGVQRLGLDLFGGCVNVRKMRGGSSWSIHSWGAAVDLDPDHNQLKWGRDKARFAGADYEPFWRIVEAQGLVSLGRSSNYDFMHFQAARLK